MVVRLVKLITLTCLMLVTTSIQAKVDFAASVSTQKVELGKTFTLTLASTGGTGQLSSINFTELARDFHINKSANIEYNEQLNRQHWKLRLTAYNKGQQAIPSLLFNNLRSEIIQINVTDAIDKKTGTPIHLVTQISNQQPWVRQQVLVNIQLKTNIARAKLRLNKAKIKNTFTQTLDINHELISSEQSTQHHYHTGWAVFPLISGKTYIKLPAVELIRDGVTTHRFYHAPFNLEVTALPLYIPATIPVGRIELRNDSSYQYFISEKLYEYKIRLTGHNMLVSHLPNLSNQMSSTPSLRIYPAATIRTQTNTYSGLTSTIEYSFPVKTLKQGATRLEKIRLSYFDPETGTLKTTYHSNLGLLSMNKWLSWLLAVVLIIILIYFFKLILTRTSQYYTKLRTYVDAIKLIKNDCTPQQLRNAMALLSTAEGFSPNITFGAWFKSVPRINQPGDCLDAINELFYKKSGLETKTKVTENIASTILNIAFSNQPVLRYFIRLRTN